MILQGSAWYVNLVIGVYGIKLMSNIYYIVSVSLLNKTHF